MKSANGLRGTKACADLHHEKLFSYWKLFPTMLARLSPALANHLVYLYVLRYLHVS